MDGLAFTEPTRNHPELPLWKLIKYVRDLWPLRNREDDAWRTQQQESNLRQSWGQAFVALVAFGRLLPVYSCFGQSSPVHSPVQSIVQSSPESRFFRDPNFRVSGNKFPISRRKLSQMGRGLHVYVVVTCVEPFNIYCYESQGLQKDGVIQ